MKLYAILYFAGKVAAFVGPWPSATVEGCLTANKQLEQHADQIFTDRPILKAGQMSLSREDVTTACEFRETKPAIGE